MQACADPTFGLPQQILNLVRFLGTVEPLFAAFDGDQYVITVETEAREGNAIIRMYHPDWKHRCLHFRFSETYENQGICLESWAGPHPTEEHPVNTVTVEDLPEHVFDFGDFGGVVNHVLTAGDTYYRQVLKDEAEAREMAEKAMKQPDLKVMQGGKG
jgi:hypothetical protein